MHSCVTRKPPCAVRMTGPETVVDVPAAVSIAPPPPAIPARDDVHERALVEERRRGEVRHHERGGQQQEAPRRGPEHDPGSAPGSAAGRGRAPLAVHPGEDVAGGRQDQDAGPDMDVQQMEQVLVGRHQRQVADAHHVQQHDGQQTERRAAQARAPGGGIGQDGPRAQRHRSAAAAARVEHQQVGVRAGELVGDLLLDLRERGQEVVLDPVEPQQAEQADEPGAHGHHEARAAAGRRRVRDWIPT